jgi:hypothetical protein
VIRGACPRVLGHLPAPLTHIYQVRNEIVLIPLSSTNIQFKEIELPRKFSFKVNKMAAICYRSVTIQQVGNKTLYVQCIMQSQMKRVEKLMMALQ